MPNDFILTALTRDPTLARAADEAGVDRIGIDIERLGKHQRQGARPELRFSDHELDDLTTLKKHVRRAEIFVRLNPLHEGSRAEIERALELGAQVVMLPYFSAPDDARCFAEMIGGRAKPVLLIETAAAAARIREIAAVPGVAEIMVGLNDLHMSLGMAHPFEVLASDAIAAIAGHVRAAGLRFGFGGVARAGDRMLPVPPDLIYPQYPLLGATAAWLARSFYTDIGPPEIAGAVQQLRERLAFWSEQPFESLRDQRAKLVVRLRSIGSVARGGAGRRNYPPPICIAPTSTPLIWPEES